MTSNGLTLGAMRVMHRYTCSGTQLLIMAQDCAPVFRAIWSNVLCVLSSLSRYLIFSLSRILVISLRSSVEYILHVFMNNLKHPFTKSGIINRPKLNKPNCQFHWECNTTSVSFSTICRLY